MIALGRNALGAGITVLGLLIAPTIGAGDEVPPVRGQAEEGYPGSVFFRTAYPGEPADAQGSGQAPGVPTTPSGTGAGTSATAPWNAQGAGGAAAPAPPL